MMMTMPELHVGRGAGVGPLTVFPVWTGAPSPSGLVTGKAAQVQVAERTADPVVSQVMLANTGYRMALLVEGELLEGGLQHRVLRHDAILAPGASMVAEVACVEAGRWGSPSAFRRQSRRASASVRAALNLAPEASQAQVWSRVAQYDAAISPSPTSSYVDHLERLSASGPLHLSADSEIPVGDLVGQVHQLRALPGQRGLIAAVAGYPVLLELFASSSALAAHMHQMLTGLLLDALAAGAGHEPTPSRRARRFAGCLDGVPAVPQRDVDAGSGEVLAAEAADFLLRGVTLAGRWAHATVFNRRHALVGLP